MYTIICSSCCLFRRCFLLLLLLLLATVVDSHRNVDEKYSGRQSCDAYESDFIMKCIAYWSPVLFPIFIYSTHTREERAKLEKDEEIKYWLSFVPLYVSFIYINALVYASDTLLLLTSSLSILLMHLPNYIINSFSLSHIIRFFFLCRLWCWQQFVKRIE